jgi:hypothetical protein
MMANVYSAFEMIVCRKKTVLGEVPYSNAIVSNKNAIKVIIVLNPDLRGERHKLRLGQLNNYTLSK